METNGNQSSGMFHGYSFEYEQDEEGTSKQEEEAQESSDMATQPVVSKKQKIQQTEEGN